jgi:YHS domain-containing protein
MFRLILYMLLAVVLISILRMVIGVVMKGLAALLNSGHGAASSSERGSSRLGGILHRDPMCGTYVAESTTHQRRIGSETFYYCSETCKEKHELVPK